MTLITGLKCYEAVVLASDSQITVEGGLKTTGPKLFATSQGIIGGMAGPIAAAQAVESHFEIQILEGNPGKEAGRQAVRTAMMAAAAELPGASEATPGRQFSGLFAWHADDDGRNYLIKAHSDGIVEFLPDFGTVGSNSELAGFGFFGFGSSDFLEYETLPLETAKMLVYKVTDDVVLASAKSVDQPIQLAVASRSASGVLDEKDLQPVRDTASAFRMHQADFLERIAEPSGEDVDGLLPSDGKHAELADPEDHGPTAHWICGGLCAS